MWPPSSGVLHSVNAADSDASHHHSGLSLVLVSQLCNGSQMRSMSFSQAKKYLPAAMLLPCNPG
jgi:hypothetical protein